MERDNPSDVTSSNFQAQLTSSSTPKSILFMQMSDYGVSTLNNGERRHKSDIVFDALGTIDELNSNVG